MFSLISGFRFIWYGAKQNKWLLGARPTNGIAIKIKIQSKFGVFWFKMYPNDHNKTLHMSHVQNFIVISWIGYEQDHYKFSLNFEFDRNIISKTGAKLICMINTVMNSDKLIEASITIYRGYIGYFSQVV